MKVKFVTCVYSDLYGTEFGGRSSRKFHYQHSLSSILNVPNSEFVLYTSEREYDSLANFFYKEKSISKDKLKILTYELTSTKRFEAIKQKKNIEKMKTLDRCYEIQYNKFYWLQENLDDIHDHFFWIDAGLSHCGIIPPEYRNMSHPVEKYYNSFLFNDRFLKNLINKTQDNVYIIGKNNTGKHFWSQTVPPKYYTSYDNSLHIIGGLFGGTKKNVQWFANEFDLTLDMLLAGENDLYFEELVMSLIYQNNKPRFVVDCFDTWWYKESAPQGVDSSFFDENKSFFKILTDLQK